MRSRYESPKHIKKEFIDFLNWYKNNYDKSSLCSKDLSKIFDSYQKEKDFCFYGDLRKIHGANTRNSTKEVLFLFGALFVAIIIIYFFN